MTLRGKLMLLVSTATFALLAVIGGSVLIGVQQSRGLADVQGRLIPRLQIAPEIRARFERIRQQMRDAVSAQDSAALEATLQDRDELMALVARSTPAIEADDIDALRTAIREYCASSYNISRRLIAGETGEKIVQDMELMQQRDRRARSVLDRTTAIGEPELRAGFEVVRHSAAQADRFRLVMGVSGLLLVVLLSTWLTRGLLRSLSHLSQGFSRFGTGDFNEKISVLSVDELGDVAKKANDMANRLQRLNEQRDRVDWLKATQLELSDQLREDVNPRELTRRALWFLAQRVGACSGACYLHEGDGRLALGSQYAGGSGIKEFELGKGLVGQAALNEEMTVITDVPPGYLTLQSGVGSAAPVTLMLLPLTHLNDRVGVLELSFLGPPAKGTEELLQAVRIPLALGLSVALARAAQSELLGKTREQAERLAVQEDELRTRNQELVSQQADLQQLNTESEVQRHELSEQNAELEETRERLQQQAEELARVSSYKSQFLANMSHELRTPLNSMLLLSGLLAENASANLTERQVEHARTVNAAGRDLLNLINQILDLAKIEAGKQELNLEAVVLQDLIEHARSVFQPLAAQKALSIQIEYGEKLPRAIVTDRQRLQGILTNLIGNAIKFTDQGSVTVRLTRPADNARWTREDLDPRSCIALQVIDTGVGIAPDEQERVFAPFEQAGLRASRKSGGTGLGLSIARESVSLLGGELQLRSTIGQGSEFTCYLPEISTSLTTALDPSKHANMSLVPIQLSKTPLRPGKTVEDDRLSLHPGDSYLLIFEDDVVFAEQLVEICRARKFKVVTTNNAGDGLQRARSHPPAGIILDIGLPDIDGWTVMEHLKHDRATRNVPVHFVSATDAPQRGLALGAVGYLVKPTTYSELVGLVRTMASTPGTSSNVLVVEDDQREGASLVDLLLDAHIQAKHVGRACDALTELAAREFGCMVLDLGLPDMDGLGLLDALSERKDIIRPRVIVHTGRTLSGAETRRLQLYAESIIHKDPSSKERVLEQARSFVQHVEDGRVSESSNVPQSGSTLQGSKILLTDDDMRTVYALSALLRGWGAEVLVAENGKEALDVLAREPGVGLVLMDVMMPEMDGLEAMRRIRLEPRFEKLPIVALTASAINADRTRCLEAGASDYLLKPLESARLLSTVCEWLAPGSHPS